MSLVAYGSSGEESENEENEVEKETIATNKVEKETIVTNDDTNDDTMETIILHTNSKLSLPSPKVHQISHTKDEEEERCDAKTFENFFDMLPKPESLNSVKNLEENNDDVLLKKKIETQTIKPVKKQTVKISVPSLSEFKDLEEEEEEEEEKPAKIVQPSQKGCGLFSILMPPSKERATNKILIPQSVKNTTSKANIQQLKERKSNSSQINDSKIKQPILDKLYNETSSDEEDTTEDFFGLTTNKDISDSSSSKAELLSYDFTYKSHAEETSLRKEYTEDRTAQDFSTVISDTLTTDQLGNSSKTLISNVINLPKEEILQKNKAEVGPKLPVPEQEYNIDTEGNVAFDEKAIEYLCGRRGIKRKDTEIDEANIIEINGEDIKPDEREWLVKALTEESVQRPISMQSGGISSQSKKKHQITYLAHQAKAMELELKNQWSQNRMTRKQTKSKYGF